VITHFKDIRAPLFVLQGDNDTRIPKEESGRLADILKKQGNVVDAVFHPEEGRGFDKPITVLTRRAASPRGSTGT
jgi:dipeptidyl aminopeptidase/acylaminoacyl peptidase